MPETQSPIQQTDGPKLHPPPKQLVFYTQSCGMMRNHTATMLPSAIKRGSSLRPCALLYQPQACGIPQPVVVATACMLQT
jgi:hypothetical protein